MIEIELTNGSGLPVDEAAVRDLCRRVLAAEGVEDGELGVMLAPPERMRAVWVEVFYDGLKEPSISVPFVDFFGLPHGRPARVPRVLLPRRRPPL